MEIALNDLKVALSRAQECGFTTPNGMGAFAWGYLSAGPLDEDEVVAEADPRVGLKIEREEDMKGLPEGTRAVDRDGDTHEIRGGVWVLVRWKHLTEDRNPDLVHNERDSYLELYLPATIVKVGA